jgi:hypothetical protein
MLTAHFQISTVLSQSHLQHNTFQFSQLIGLAKSKTTSMVCELLSKKRRQPPEFLTPSLTPRSSPFHLSTPSVQVKIVASKKKKKKKKKPHSQNSFTRSSRQITTLPFHHACCNLFLHPNEASSSPETPSRKKNLLWTTMSIAHLGFTKLLPCGPEGHCFDFNKSEPVKGHSQLRRGIEAIVNNVTNYGSDSTRMGLQLLKQAFAILRKLLRQCRPTYEPTRDTLRTHGDMRFLVWGRCRDPPFVGLTASTPRFSFSNKIHIMRQFLTAINNSQPTLRDIKLNSSTTAAATILSPLATPDPIVKPHLVVSFDFVISYSLLHYHTSASIASRLSASPRGFMLLLLRCSHIISA